MRVYRMLGKVPIMIKCLLEIVTTCEPSSIAIIASYGTRVLYQTGYLRIVNKNELRTLINLFEYQGLHESGRL